MDYFGFLYLCSNRCFVNHKLNIYNNKQVSMYIIIYIFEGSLEVKLPTIWTDEKQSREEAERRERLEERRIRRKRCRCVKR